MKKILFLIVSTILALQVLAQGYDIKSKKLYYKIIDQNTVQLVGNNTYKELISVIIPETVKKYTVVGIADGAFKNCYKLQSVSIPISVTNIGGEAFYDCKKLTSVTFAEGSQLTNIGNDAFCGCKELTSITIPKSVATIGDEAFLACKELASVTFAEGSRLTRIGNDAFCNCWNKLTTISIPEGVTSIGDEVFRNCPQLASVTIPNSVTSIGKAAFENCTKLLSVTIPNTISEISEKMFAGCTSLKSVTIPNSISKIGPSAFSGCENMTDVNIPSSVEEIGSGAFMSCHSLTQIKIPASVKIIEGEAIRDCPNLKNVYCEVNDRPSGWYPNWISMTIRGVYEIVKWGNGEKSTTVNKKTSSAKDFYGEDPVRYYDFSAVCSSGQTLYYKYMRNPSTVRICRPMWYPNLAAELKTYGDCERPKGNLIIPETVTYGGKTYIVTEISDGVFNDCNELTSVTIPNCIAKIGENAFIASENLTSVTIKSEARCDNAGLYLRKGGIRYKVLNKNEVMVDTKEYESPFFNSNPKKYSGDIVIPSKVIAGNTFSVVAINDAAFAESIDLKTVTIPNVVKTIGRDAFRNCIHLTAIYCQVKSEPIGWDVNWNPNKYKVVWGAIDKFK